jgi:hypothetical protein
MSPGASRALFSDRLTRSRYLTCPGSQAATKGIAKHGTDQRAISVQLRHKNRADPRRPQSSSELPALSQSRLKTRRKSFRTDIMTVACQNGIAPGSCSQTEMEMSSRASFSRAKKPPAASRSGVPALLPVPTGVDALLPSRREGAGPILRWRPCSRALRV